MPKHVPQAQCAKEGTPHAEDLLSHYAMYRVQEDMSDPHSADKVRIVAYSLPSWAVADNIAAVIDQKLRLSVLARWGTLATRLEGPLGQAQNEALATLIREHWVPHDTPYAYCGVVAFSPEQRYVASFYYSPSGLPLQGCSQGFARYRIIECDLGTMVETDRCCHNPDSDFSGFVDTASVFAYVLDSRRSVDAWCTYLNAAVQRIGRDGSITAVADLLAHSIRASPSGERVLLVRADMDSMALDIQMRSPDLQNTVWQSSLASSQIGCRKVLWSDDSSIVVVFPAEWKATRAVFYRATDGLVLMDTKTPFAGLSSRGPLTLARTGDTSAVLKQLGLKRR